MDEFVFYNRSRYSHEQRQRCSQADTFESRCTRLLRIQALLAVTASMLVFLGVFGLFRRRSGNRKLAMMAFGAYTLSPPIIAYTLGLIQSAPFCSLHFPVWAAYLVVVLGSADSYTAHSIEDIEQWKSFNLDSAAKCFMTSWMIASYVTHSMSPLFTVFLFVILFVKIDERARALMLASNSVMEKKCKLIADYMSTEHKDNDGNPATMDGYKYLVRLAEDAKVHSLSSTATCRPKASPWRDGKAPHYQQKLKEKHGVITVEKVWSCKEGLLSESGDPEGRLKDLCLSFSLFKFICLRFAGYSLLPDAHKKLWRLIEHMLRKGNGHERVFRLIEVELAFLFDLFYTKYPVNLDWGRSFCRLLLLPIVVAVALISMSFQVELSDPRSGVSEERTLNRESPVIYAIIYRKELAVFVTILLMMSMLVIEFGHFGIMIFSEWAKVMYICKYVQNEWWQKNRCAGKLIEIMCRVWLLKPWGRQLRQYSFLDAYGYSPWKCYNRLTAAYLDPKRDGQKQIAPVNLSKQVTKAIAQSLGKYSTGNLEKGKASLRLNDEYLKDAFRELSWACDLETATHVIMVWHIATTICEHEKPLSGPQLSQEHIDNFAIATKLSKYLAYLVAFAPRLLPGHPCRTEYIFDQAVSEARKFFGRSSVSMRERIQKLKTITDNDDDGDDEDDDDDNKDDDDGKDDDDDIEQRRCRRKETIVRGGARLGRQLVNAVANDEGELWKIWKVLADFWVEMMFYVAPSNNTAAHAKYLTMGGEFVTHVWVLVTHVGITRDPPSGEQHGNP